jgi:subtilisin-like proprotein convertase family protein
VSTDRMRVMRRIATVAVVASGGLSMSPVAANADGSLGGRAARQIAALQQIKSSQSPTERKLDSRLVVALRRRLDPASLRLTPRLTTGVAISNAGRTEVDVRATTMTAGLLDRLRGVGAELRHASTRVDSVRAALPLSALTAVASWKAVRRIDLATGVITGRRTLPGGTGGAPTSKAARAARLDQQLRSALAGPQGTVVSEGDRAHAADRARSQTRVNGVGVKVCVLSDGVDSRAALQAAGELPAVDVLVGQEGGGDEGTAILEIVHDLAPKAALGFATAINSDASFADNIRALRFQSHCDVLVDDILWLNEDPFQDGPIAQSVNAVTADGALYFSSAGNEGNSIDGTSGNYEATFVSSRRSIAKFQGVAHDFAPGPAVQLFEPLSDASVGVPVTLFWADPLGRARDDYDLYLLDAAGNVVAFSQNVQSGTGDPFEILGTLPAPGLRLAVVKYSGATRYFQLSALGGRFSNSADGLVARVTPGVTRGHSAAVDAFSTAAAPAASPLPFSLEPGDPANPAGPFPNAFTAVQAPERFTSDGPRRVFFNADGAPITPGNLTATGGAVRPKPDITAADGVQVATPGFSPFFGTSAAAPHAAAIAALVLSGNPGATLADVRGAFDATALDLAPAGVDDRTGHGIVMADSVLADTGATPQPLVQAAQPSVTPSRGDGDPFLEPGEAATVALPVTDAGDGTATGVSVRVTTDDLRATVTPRAQSYGDLAPGATASRDFGLALTPDYPLGRPVRLAVKVTFAGALSPTTTTLTIPTGHPAGTSTSFAYPGPPVAIPDESDIGASVPISVPAGFGYASRLTFSIDGTACTTAAGATTVGLDHTFVRDLVATLTSPAGRAATLFQRSGGNGHNLCRVVFDDAAPDAFDAVTAEQAPFTGTWRPLDRLDAFLADQVGGTWTFTVRDVAAADTGSIRTASLHISGFVAQ